MRDYKFVSLVPELEMLFLSVMNIGENIRNCSGKPMTSKSKLYIIHVNCTDVVSLFFYKLSLPNFRKTKQIYISIPLRPVRLWIIDFLC